MGLAMLTLEEAACFLEREGVRNAVARGVQLSHHGLQAAVPLDQLHCPHSSNSCTSPRYETPHMSVHEAVAKR